MTFEAGSVSAAASFAGPRDKGRDGPGQLGSVPHPNC